MTLALRYDIISSYEQRPDKKSPEEMASLILVEIRGVKSRLDSIESRISVLETTAEQRQLETRPIWERALAEIAESRHEIAEMRNEIAEGRNDVRELGRSTRDAARNLRTLHENMLPIQSDLRDIDKLLALLEEQMIPRG